MSKTVSYFGTCDASAAVRLDPSLFVAASDEDSCVYDSGVPGPPSSSLDLIDFLNPINRQGEGRREVAALIGDRWSISPAASAIDASATGR
jgi:hypothetical protein